MFTLTSGKLTFAVSEDASCVEWSASGLPLRQSPDADFWRAFLDDGYYMEMKVSSSRQKGQVSLQDGVMTIAYDSLVGDDGRVFDINLKITVKVATQKYAGFLFSAEIENNSDARLNELMLPLVDLANACDENRENDVFYQIEGLGRKFPNPWDSIRKKSHTEYIAADQFVVWNSQRYPGDGAMGWIGLETGGHFLYLGRHDPKLKICVLSVGTSPRDADPRLLMTISHVPSVKPGHSVKTIETFLSLNEGDWRTGSDIYRSYAEENWYTAPVVPEWVKNMTGWQRIILRHQYGQINFKYEDLPRIYENGKKYGLSMLLVFGWWKGRFDNGYPVYEPDDELGGAEGLKAAIAKVQEMGGRVALYTNGQLIDVNTDYYREIGHKVCRIDIDGNDYRDHYRFGNCGTHLRSFGYKSFVTACSDNAEWQNRVVMHEKKKFDFGADSAFFDQIGAAAPLPCFNEEHDHGARPDECEYGRIKAFEKLRANCPEGKAVGTEMVCDMVIPYVQYIHGIQIGAVFTDDCFPNMFMRTFPELIQSDRFVHDYKEGMNRSLNHAFIRGFRFDVSPWRGMTDISSIPQLGEKLGEIIKLKEEYHRFFYDGRYVVEDRPAGLPECVNYGEFVHGNETMYALWNDSDSEVNFTVAGKEITMKAQEVKCVCLA